MLRKWNHTVFWDFGIRFIQVVACVSSLFLVLLIIFYGMDVPHFSHSPPERKIWVFQFGSTTNKAAVNIEHLVTSGGIDMCCHFLWVHTWQWNCWIVYLTFWGISRLFPKAAAPAPFYSPISSSVWMISFSASLLAFGIGIFYFSHSDRWLDAWGQAQRIGKGRGADFT